MPDRTAQIDSFLAKAGWQDARQTPLAGDLSPRRYSRLSRAHGTAILMDADSTMEPFARMTDWLRAAEFSAPEILAGEPADGLLLLEDFGDVSVTNLLSASPGETDKIHEQCVDLLLAIRAAKPPAHLPCPDPETLVSWTELTDQYYPGTNTAGLAAFREVLTELLLGARAHTPTVSLRDFHADNLMWLPEREGHRRFGLLDYQDAFLTHPAYDLVSFLTDARTDVPKALRERTLTTYLQRSGDNAASFRQAFSALSAQRNLRVLGIFALAAANARKHHLDKLPRVQSYFAEALEHPAFDAVRDETLAALPDPNDVIEALSG